MTDELCSAVERKKKRKTEKEEEKETNLSPRATLASSVRVRIMLAVHTYRGISWLGVPDSLLGYGTVPRIINTIYDKGLPRWI